MRVTNCNDNGIPQYIAKKEGVDVVLVRVHRSTIERSGKQQISVGKFGMKGVSQQKEFSTLRTLASSQSRCIQCARDGDDHIPSSSLVRTVLAVTHHEKSIERIHDAETIDDSTLCIFPIKIFYDKYHGKRLGTLRNDLEKNQIGESDTNCLNREWFRNYNIAYFVIFIRG